MQIFAKAFLGAALATLAACATPEPGQNFADPYEQRNRKVHEMSKRVDTNLLRPAAMAYGKTVPDPVRVGVANMASNLSLPSTVLNGVLQANPELVVNNTFRFVINSTVGIAGIFDPAAKMGLTKQDADFGGTLHVWGAREGAYLQVPVLGPSTERDIVGKAVDAVTNPLSLMFPPQAIPVTRGIKVADVLGDRYRFDNTISSTLYESADSYAQLRSVYLQNRRYELGMSAVADETAYDDPYAETAADPYSDPYADPYAALE